jgi:hypothetical protein
MSEKSHATSFFFFLYWSQRLFKKEGLTTLGGDDAALAESALEQLEVGLLEEGLGGALGVGRVGDDDVELVLVVVEELEAIADVHLDLGVLVSDAHAGQVLLAEADDGLVDVAEHGALDAVVLDDLAQDAAVAAADDEDVLGVGVREHAQVGDHLLVGELVALGALDDVVEDEHHAVVGGLEDEDILVERLLVVDDLVDLEGHGLAGPHLADLAEPAWSSMLVIVSWRVGRSLVRQMFPYHP